MTKYLVEVYVPAIIDTYDIWVSEELSVYETVQMVATAVEKLSDGMFIVTEELALYSRENGDKLPMEMYLGEIGVNNGMSWMLI